MGKIAVRCSKAENIFYSIRSRGTSGHVVTGFPDMLGIK
jgi:hypothetical protein